MRGDPPRGLERENGVPRERRSPWPGPTRSWPSSEVQPGRQAGGRVSGMSESDTTDISTARYNSILVSGAWDCHLGGQYEPRTEGPVKRRQTGRPPERSNVVTVGQHNWGPGERRQAEGQQSVALTGCPTVSAWPGATTAVLRCGSAQCSTAAIGSSATARHRTGSMVREYRENTERIHREYNNSGIRRNRHQTTQRIQENTSVLTAGMVPTTARCQSDRWVSDVCSAQRGRIRRDHTGEIPPRQQRRDQGRREYAQESRDHRKNTQHSELTTAVHQWSPIDRIATTFRHGERRVMAAEPPYIPENTHAFSARERPTESARHCREHRR